MADRVHPAVTPVQDPALDSLLDPVVAEPGVNQLRGLGEPVLSLSELSERSVDRGCAG